MKERKRVFRWFWAWNDEKEERWLEQMALSGWHLVSGPVIYTFEQNAPARVRYRLDYQPKKKNLDEYLRLCRDSGWERVLEFAGWQYLRTASPDAPEIYTDMDSRIAMHRRLLTVCVVLAVLAVVTNLNTLLGGPGHPESRSFFFVGLRWMVVAIICLWAYILGRMLLHIRSLKRRPTAGRQV